MMLNDVYYALKTAIFPKERIIHCKQRNQNPSTVKSCEPGKKSS